ncbi:MAG: ABC transporter substrate-binding protein [Magnetococcales bacterium]|nr:ABC transporter substrate-binding protein [Magnetococcales bacterium]
MVKHIFFLIFLFFVWIPTLFAAHGLSLDGTLKYPADFERFDYTSPKAAIGGELILDGIGGFDKMNPFTLKGTAPEYLDTLVFETLTTRSLDEPFAQYGLLAQNMEVAPDGLSVVYTLNPAAKFADGSPVTAHDVAFSFTTLMSDKAQPNFRSYWQDIARAEVISDQVVRFHFRQKNRELPLITGEMPILSRAFFAKQAFDQADLTPPLGSGPYQIKSFQPGKIITYERRADYWGWKLPVRRGQFNFQQITIKYFRDPQVALEGFKAGEFIFNFENNSKQWARDYQGEKFDQGLIVKETLPHKNSAGMQGFVMNLRRPFFKDIRVRKAFNLAFDFEWSNLNLFYGQYTRSESYFTNSELAAQGTPSPEELALLEPFRNQLDPVVFQDVLRPPSTLPPHSLRDNLRQAMALLKEAGWKMGPNGILLNAEGKPFEVDALLGMQAFERVLGPYAENLRKLGIRLNYRTVDLSLYQRRLENFDFDLIVGTYGQSLSPGNEQRGFWHSSQAQVPGSRNLIGIENPVVDALVDHIIYAKDRPALITACRALDRVLRSGWYMVPHFHIPFHRVAYWNRFAKPEKLPLYYTPHDWLFTWWFKKDPTATGKKP